MAEESASPPAPAAVSVPESDVLEIDLKNPVVAGILGWLLPGAGHMYQRRFAKGTLFMLCILGTYFFGLSLADGHVVYASLTDDDFRWQYGCQLGVGAAALPALVQTHRVRNDKDPLLNGFMAPPRNVKSPHSSHDEYASDELSEWNRKYHSYFELGTLYTMIAGLLNILAIYDAVSGPVLYGSAGGTVPGRPPLDPKSSG